MRRVLNILWLIFGGGAVTFVVHVLVGALLCVTVVGIPFGLQCFKLAKLGVFPFGKDIESEPGGGAVRTGLNVVWFIVAGLWIFLSHIALGIALALTIIGLPFAWQHLKLGILALAPFGERILTT